MIRLRPEASPPARWPFSSQEGRWIWGGEIIQRPLGPGMEMPPPHAKVTYRVGPRKRQEREGKKTHHHPWESRPASRSGGPSSVGYRPRWPVPASSPAALPPIKRTCREGDFCNCRHRRKRLMSSSWSRNPLRPAPRGKSLGIKRWGDPSGGSRRWGHAVTFRRRRLQRQKPGSVSAPTAAPRGGGDTVDPEEPPPTGVGASEPVGSWLPRG